MIVLCHHLDIANEDQNPPQIMVHHMILRQFSKLLRCPPSRPYHTTAG
jgi:hypothetical protein